MKWVSVSNQTAAVSTFHLMDNDRCTLVLKYNPKQRSARVTSGVFQRLFFIETTGSLSGKLLFKNEYGVAIGAADHPGWGMAGGNLQMDEHRFHFQLTHQPNAQITLHEMAHPQITHCSFEETTPLLKGRDATIEQCSLLLALCWYQQLPSLVKTVAGYAA